jgi:hypothetical protein
MLLPYASIASRHSAQKLYDSLQNFGKLETDAKSLQGLTDKMLKLHKVNQES